MKRSREQVDGPIEGKVEQKHRVLLSFAWDTEALEAFARSANEHRDAWWQSASAPEWVRTPPPFMTPKSIVEDMLMHLRPLVGRRMGSHMLTMATFDEYKNTVRALQMLVEDPFVQVAMDATVLARPLASLHVKFGLPGFGAVEQSPVILTRSGRQVFT